jgi:hypothetical protein
LKELNATIGAAISHLNDSHDEESRQNLKLIFEIQNRISLKQKELADKILKLKELEERQLDVHNKLSQKRKEVEDLRGIAVALKTEFTQRRNFAKSCH